MLKVYQDRETLEENKLTTLSSAVTQHMGKLPSPLQNEMRGKGTEDTEMRKEIQKIKTKIKHGNTALQ